MITVVPEDTELDPRTAPRLVEQMHEVPLDEDLRLDFASVTFCDSSGLRAVLMEHIRRWSDGTSKVIVANPSPQVKRLFQIVQLTHLLEDR